MNPAPSVIIFTVLSGMGFGLLAFLGAGFPAPQGWMAFYHWGLAYGLAVAGLIASTFHLGQPSRALKAFSQWRTSWLSREAWSSVATLVVLAPMALSDWLGWGLPRALGYLGAVGCFATVFTTSMIYAQMKSVPRWNNWTVPVKFLAFEACGGAILSGNQWPALAGCLLLAFGIIAHFQKGMLAFFYAEQDLGKATGLDRVGKASVFELPHTGPNYLMREMIYIVGRKHAIVLRAISLLFSVILPWMLLFLLPLNPFTYGLVALVHLTGALASRWLFFAEAEHLVGLYYGQHQL